MAKMITIKPKKELIITKGTQDQLPRFIKLKENEDIYMQIPRETFTKKNYNPDLDIRLIQVNNKEALNNYALYIGELVGVANNRGDVPNVLIEVLSDMFHKCIEKREKMEGS